MFTLVGASCGHLCDSTAFLLIAGSPHNRANLIQRSVMTSCREFRGTRCRKNRPGSSSSSSKHGCVLVARLYGSYRADNMTGVVLICVSNRVGAAVTVSLARAPTPQGRSPAHSQKSLGAMPLFSPPRVWAHFVCNNRMNIVLHVQRSPGPLAAFIGKGGKEKGKMVRTGKEENKVEERREGQEEGEKGREWRKWEEGKGKGEEEGRSSPKYKTSRLRSLSVCAFSHSTLRLRIYAPGSHTACTACHCRKSTSDWLKYEPNSTIDQLHRKFPRRRR